MPASFSLRLLAHRRDDVRLPLLLVGSLIALMTNCGCQTALLSGRKQLMIIPETQEIRLGRQAYAQILAEEPLSQNKPLVAMVNRVGKRIADAADKPGYDWEFQVIAKDDKNAFALPGGKVVIYEGLIPICQDEAGLAVVMSHEIAHAVARHGGERMSQRALVDGVGGVINAVGQQQTDKVTTEKILSAYGALSTYGVILPYSRKHESEADAIGLILMARAGYDPSVAPEFWDRFSRHSGTKPPELLSTHPSDARRAATLRALLPEAMNYYEAAPVQLGMGEILPAIHKRQPSVSPQTLANNDARRAPARPRILTPSSDGSRKASSGPPASLPRKLESPSEIRTVAFNEPFEESESSVQPDSPESAEPSAEVESTAGAEPFRLPVAMGDRASNGGDKNEPPIEWSQSADDGWRPATGRAEVSEAN